MVWHYERGDHRHKHRWKHDFAGFVPGKKGPIGKCPKHVTQEIAEKALNEGVPFYDTPAEIEDDAPLPNSILREMEGKLKTNTEIRTFKRWLRKYSP